jgi:hypothetical protein
MADGKARKVGVSEEVEIEVGFGVNGGGSDRRGG